MRTAITLFAALILLAACSGEDKKAARQKKITEYKAQIKVLNGDYAAMRALPEHAEVRVASYKAQATLKGAKTRDDAAALAAAQAAYDEASAAAERILAKEQAVEKQIQDLRDKIYDLGGTP